MNAPARRTCIRTAARSAGLPLYMADLATTRGRCRKRRCPSRWAITRVSIDFRAERVDRIATTECTLCGRTWRRVSVPALRSAAGYQAVKLTILLPSSVHRWRSRGRWHRQGEDALIVRDADLGDLDEAATTHGIRADRLADSRARRTAAAAAIESERHAATMTLLARLAERDAERAAAERAASEREVAIA